EVTPPDFTIRLHVGRRDIATTIEVDDVIQIVEGSGIAAVGEFVAEDEEVVSKPTERPRCSAAEGRLNLGPDDAPVVSKPDRVGFPEDRQLGIRHPVATAGTDDVNSGVGRITNLNRGPGIGDDGEGRGGNGVVT